MVRLKCKGYESNHPNQTRCHMKSTMARRRGTCSGPETPNPTATGLSVMLCSSAMRPFTISFTFARAPVTPANPKSPREHAVRHVLARVQ